MAKPLTKLDKDTNIHIQEANQTQNEKQKNSQEDIIKLKSKIPRKSSKQQKRKLVTQKGSSINVTHT